MVSSLIPPLSTIWSLTYITLIIRCFQLSFDFLFLEKSICANHFDLDTPSNPGFVKEDVKEDDRTDHLPQVSLFWVLLVHKGLLPYLILNFTVH